PADSASVSNAVGGPRHPGRRRSVHDVEVEIVVVREGAPGAVGAGAPAVVRVTLDLLQEPGRAGSEQNPELVAVASDVWGRAPGGLPGGARGGGHGLGASQPRAQVAQVAGEALHHHAQPVQGVPQAAQRLARLVRLAPPPVPLRHPGYTARPKGREWLALELALELLHTAVRRQLVRREHAVAAQFARHLPTGARLHVVLQVAARAAVLTRLVRARRLAKLARVHVCHIVLHGHPGPAAGTAALHLRPEERRRAADHVLHQGQGGHEGGGQHPLAAHGAAAVLVQPLVDAAPAEDVPAPALHGLLQHRVADHADELLVRRGVVVFQGQWPGDGSCRTRSAGRGPPPGHSPRPSRD
ncbi:unnamed protein product, partial [Ixodes persulcatus]